VVLLTLPFVGLQMTSQGDGALDWGPAWISVAILAVGVGAYLSTRFDPMHRLVLATVAAMSGYFIFAIVQSALSSVVSAPDFWLLVGIAGLLSALAGSAWGLASDIGRRDRLPRQRDAAR
jgi:hypothetical protein